LFLERTINSTIIITVVRDGIRETGRHGRPGQRRDVEDVAVVQEVALILPAQDQSRARRPGCLPECGVRAKCSTRTHARPLHAGTRTGSARAQARGHGMHAHKCTCEALGTQARPFESLGTLPRKLLGTPIWKACRGLVRRCPRGSGWRSISVDGAGLGQSQSGRPGSGSCLLGASFSGAPSSRRLRADSLPRVTRHGNPQRCSIRRWWGKLRGAGLERGVSRRGAGQL